MTTGRDIARGLRHAYMVMHRKTQWLLALHGLTADQYVMLAILSQEDGITQNELNARASSDPNTLRAVLMRMERKSLVVRMPHETDRRARKVLLTAKGKRLYPILSAALLPLQEVLLSSFSAEEAGRLVDGLARIESATRHWKPDPQTPSSRPGARRHAPRPAPANAADRPQPRRPTKLHVKRLNKTE